MRDTSENIYDLKLTKVSNYKIAFSDTDERNFEFDTDEVTLERHSEPTEIYTLNFFNTSTKINITFSELSILLLSRSN